MITIKMLRYSGKNVVVTYEERRCIHAAECVRGLPTAFDTGRKPWVDADAASAEAIAKVIERCPTGALQYDRRDGGAQEAPSPKNTIRVAADGPLYLRGDVKVTAANGEQVVHDKRVALCRCGKSAHKPFCDGSHTKAGFKDAGAVGKTQVKTEAGNLAGRTLAIYCGADASLGIAGNFELVDAQGKVASAGNVAWLCRCGGSANKPFCDGTHKKIGFKSS